MHKGSLASSRQVLGPYLPGPQSRSPHAEGGALYALGLIHATKGHANNGEIVSFITNALEATADEVCGFGVCANGVVGDTRVCSYGYVCLCAPPPLPPCLPGSV